MAQATVARNIQQTLDAHLHFGTQGTFHLKFVSDGGTDVIQIIIVPLVYFLAAVNTVLVKNVAGGSRADTIDIGKTDFASFVFW